jgi:SAM-dependent methyltransferase
MNGKPTGTKARGRSADSISRLDQLVVKHLRGVEFDRELGYLDLSEQRREHLTVATVAMRLPLVSAIYERWWRPGLGRIAKGISGPNMEGEYEQAAELLGLAPGDCVLDLACGPGNFTRRFAAAVEPDGLAVGFDGSESMLARAVAEARAEKLPTLALVRGEATELPFVDDAFDGVCCFAALHLFPDPLATLDEIARITKPGGRIALLISRVGGNLHDPVAHAFGRVAGIRMFREDEIRRELEQRGCQLTFQQSSGAVQIVGAVLAR